MPCISLCISFLVSLHMHVFVLYVHVSSIHLCSNMNFALGRSQFLNTFTFSLTQTPLHLFLNVGSNIFNVQLGKTSMGIKCTIWEFAQPRDPHFRSSYEFATLWIWQDSLWLYNQLFIDKVIINACCKLKKYFLFHVAFKLWALKLFLEHDLHCLNFPYDWIWANEEASHLLVKRIMIVFKIRILQLSLHTMCCRLL